MIKTLDSLKFSWHVIFHPFDGFWDLKHEKRGTFRSANIILLLLTLTLILQRQLTGFILNENSFQDLNILIIFAGVYVLFFLWCVSNWSLTSLMDGEGTFREIYINSAYALEGI